MKGEELRNTSLGISSVLQAVNALENYRFNHQREPPYRDSPEAQIPLRSHVDIREIERTARRNEPRRLAESQELKIRGELSGESILVGQEKR